MKNTLMPSERLSVVDSLRGFALLGIVLLHNLEHYNIYFKPEFIPSWLQSVDQGVWDTLFFFFGGKSYAIFSLLFGFSFFIQLRNAQKRGDSFKLRFAWRMVLLAMFAQLHAIFYNGDILLLYALVGLFLIPASYLKDKAVLWIAIILLLQPLEWIKFIYAICVPGYQPSPDMYEQYATISIGSTMNDGLWNLIKTNIVEGQLFSFLWQVENGRLLQATGLFYLGMLLGRKEYFVNTADSHIFWKKALKCAAIAFVPLYIINIWCVKLVDSNIMMIPFKIVLPSLMNFSMMAIYVSGFCLLWFKKKDGYRWQKITIPFGRMSLTNYITQSVIGVTLFYGFGFGVYKYTGASVSLVIGVMIFILLLYTSRYWLTSHKQGPLEYIWKKLTWIKLFSKI